VKTKLLQVASTLVGGVLLATVPVFAHLAAPGNEHPESGSDRKASERASWVRLPKNFL
jgi:hypothetical protein